MSAVDPLAHLGGTARMGPALRAEVETQLLEDLRYYGVDCSSLAIDWSNSCQEGHCTQHLDGNLEELSGVAAVNERGEFMAEGWLDFVHGGPNEPLHVFWLFLSVKREDGWGEVKADSALPPHVWSRLTPSSRWLCAKPDGYDQRWATDPLVRAWAAGGDA